MRLQGIAPDLGDRIGNDFIDRRCGILNPVDERRVGAVFKQAADQIGKQVFMLTDRCIDPATGADLVAFDGCS